MKVRKTFEYEYERVKEPQSNVSVNILMFGRILNQILEVCDRVIVGG